MSEKSATVIDPICGMSVDPATAAATVEHEARTYYFCGKGCAKSFSADPGKYTKRHGVLATSPGLEAPRPAGTGPAQRTPRRALPDS